MTFVDYLAMANKSEKKLIECALNGASRKRGKICVKLAYLAISLTKTTAKKSTKSYSVV